MQRSLSDLSSRWSKAPDSSFNRFRYSQASSYGQLGLLAEAEGNLAGANTCLQQALEIFVAFDDKYYAAVRDSKRALR